MGFQFLSDDWFDEAEKIRTGIDPPVPETIQNLVINVKVTGGPSGDIEAKMHAGRFVKGLSDDAPTTLTLPFDVAKKMFIEGDQNAAMQAFMSGVIQVEGDMTTIMVMQTAGPPGPEAEQAQQRVRAMTD